MQATAHHAPALAVAACTSGARVMLSATSNHPRLHQLPPRAHRQEHGKVTHHCQVEAGQVHLLGCQGKGMA
jgi:hypothetical protein